MSINSPGDWIDLGSVIPSNNEWRLTPGETTEPTSVFAISTEGVTREGVSCYCRIRAIIYSGNEIIATPSVKFYPDARQKIIELPIPEELLIESYVTRLEVKKFFRNSWKQLDLMDYSLFVQALQVPIGYYPSLSGDQPILQIDDDFDYLTYVQEQLAI
ncbi:MAG: hypothetical protein ACRC80_08635 [Waterburya sp.]